MLCCAEISLAHLSHSLLSQFLQVAVEVQWLRLVAVVLLPQLLWQVAVLMVSEA